MSSTSEVPAHESAEALLTGHTDLVLVPTLEVLLRPEAFELVPLVALVGQASPLKTLIVHSELDKIDSVAFDPRYKAEALLAQLILRENYRLKPTFIPLNPQEAEPASADAALVDVAAPVEHGGIGLDLGKEWIELTLRPMVWGLLAARPGELSDEVVSTVQDAVRAIPPVEDPQFQFTMDGFAIAGLDEYIQQLFFTGTLTDFPELCFYQLEEGENDQDDLEQPNE